MPQENITPQAETSSETSLLTPQERTVCQRIAAGSPPHSQRALALLALDQGVTEAVASERTNLSVGQIRYWLPRFKKQRLNIFPNQILEIALFERTEKKMNNVKDKTQPSESEATEEPRPSEPITKIEEVEAEPAEAAVAAQQLAEKVKTTKTKKAKANKKLKKLQKKQKKLKKQNKLKKSKKLGRKIKKLKKAK